MAFSQLRYQSGALPDFNTQWTTPQNQERSPRIPRGLYRGVRRGRKRCCQQQGARELRI
ncbi:hypothetical protein DPMN_031115 [Dreissena polymorpha]|uniref:Uncharacterized protein n=1 Tax=Dreissena polymorpha TaxID=45954 RepID=A0A9D4KPD4_DREPO|nr:hypothetical protein DPMN_116824 [Dreissena polymorpha]KAH3867979.1 hypothetical protein DPMN_031115 [Dreissena polymorpha]